jgi:hypothetical protein
LRSHPKDSEPPTRVFAKGFTAPATHVAGLAGQRVVCLLVLTQVALEVVGRLVAEIACYAAAQVSGGPERRFEPEVRFVPGIRAPGLVASMQEFLACLSCQLSVRRIAGGEGG